MKNRRKYTKWGQRRERVNKGGKKIGREKLNERNEKGARKKQNEK
jgi:hypothetical protein